MAARTTHGGYGAEARAFRVLIRVLKEQRRATVIGGRGLERKPLDYRRAYEIACHWMHRQEAVLVLG